MNRILGIGILALVALAIAMIFPRYFKQVTERQYVGFNGEAARNRHLAAERFLQRQGHSVQHLRGLAPFDQLRNDAALLWSRAPSLSERTQLLNWVRRGGHLIVDAPPSQESLLKEISVSYYWPEPDDEEETVDDKPSSDAAQQDDAASVPAPGAEAGKQAGAEATAPEDDKPAECAPDRFTCSDPTRVTAGAQEFMLELDYGARLLTKAEQAAREERASAANPQDKIEPTRNESQTAQQGSGREVAPLRSAADAEGNIMLEYPLGRGRITVVAVDRHFYNDYIGEHDHAAWLSYLIGGPKREVWFADVPLTGSFGEWLRQNAWPALLAGAIAIALGLWRAVTRFGPLLPAQAPGRLSFRDHLVACGRFHWRHAVADHLLLSVEQEAQRADAANAAALKRTVPATADGKRVEASVFTQSMRNLQRRLLAARAKRSQSRAANKP